jgi:hypothetical protein
VLLRACSDAEENRAGLMVVRLSAVCTLSQRTPRVGADRGQSTSGLHVIDPRYYAAPQLSKLKL